MKIRSLICFCSLLFAANCLLGQDVIVNKFPDKSTIYILLPYDLFFFAAETSSAEYQLNLNLTDDKRKQMYQDIVSISINEADHLDTDILLESVSLPLPAGRYKLVISLQNRFLGDKKEKQFQISIPSDSTSIRNFIIGRTDRHRLFLTDLNKPVPNLKACDLILDTYQMCDSLVLDAIIDGQPKRLPVALASGYLYDLMAVREMGVIGDLKITKYSSGIISDTGWLLNKPSDKFRQTYSLKDQLLQIKYIANQNEWKKVKNIAKQDELIAIDYFWNLHDNVPGSDKNDLRDMFTDRIVKADKLFTIHKKMPGWKSDRGRIYIRKGPPDEVSDETFPLGQPPYILWYYYKENLVYRFEDRSGFGNYTLQDEYYEN